MNSQLDALMQGHAEVSRDDMQSLAETAHLVVALVSVDGTMAACADHGDGPTLSALSSYYALVAAAMSKAGGRVVKVMGDGMLAAFPESNAKAAVECCRQVQATATA